MFSILFGDILLGIILSKLNNNAILYLLIALCIGITTISYKTYNPKLHDPKNYEYDNVISKLNNSKILSKSKLIIAHKGLAEYLKFKTGKDAMSWIPEYKIHEDSLWRITAGIRIHRLKAIINIINLGYDYCVIKEKDWQVFLHFINETNSNFYDDYINWMNPNNKRPLFLQKYKRINE